MTATIEQVAKLRRMIAEPTTTNYTDADLIDYIESYPVADALGIFPNASGWAGDTYDLNSAAADIWNEKAGLMSGNFDFSADGGNYTRSQMFEHAKKQARYYRSRRKPGYHRMIQSPNELSDFDLDDLES